MNLFSYRIESDNTRTIIADWELRKSVPGWIYIATAPNGLYKVGRTRNSIEQRLQQHSHPGFEFVLFHKIHSNDYDAAERFLHTLWGKFLYEHPNQKEWFDLPSDTAKWIRQFPQISIGGHPASRRQLAEQAANRIYFPYTDRIA